MTVWMLALLFAFGSSLLISTIRFRHPTLLQRLEVSSLGKPSASPIKVFELINSRKQSKNVKQQVLFELPEIAYLLSVALGAGESLFSAIELVIYRANGILSKELSRLVDGLKLGSTIEVELSELTRRVPGRQVAEFASKLQLAMARGTPLAAVLSAQAKTVKSEMQQQLLSMAVRNETRMLVPLIFLILPVTVLFAIYPSLQLLNLNYN